MRYKKIKLLFFIAGAIIYSCSKSKLDQPALGSLSEVEMANKKGVEGLLIGAYSVLDGISTNPLAYGAAASNWIYGSVCGTEAYKGGANKQDLRGAYPLEIFEPTAYNEVLEQKWMAVYDGVERTNTVLRIMRLAKNMTAADTTKVSAEARFLRAHYYFEAKKMWYNIPFADETVTYGAGNYFITNDTSWSMIEDDLLYSWNNLPEIQEEVGRCNKYAAEALLAKAYMFQHKYAEAKPLLEHLISNGMTSGGLPYHLLDKFCNNFDPLYKNGSESVFAAQMSVLDGSAGSNGNTADLLNFPNGIGVGGGFFRPSQYLVNHFKTDPSTGLPDLDHFNDHYVKNDEDTSSSKPFTPYDGTLDPRLDWTVGRRGVPYLDWGPNPGMDWARVQSFGGPYIPIKNVYYQKNLAEYTNADNKTWGNSTSTANNVNLIRFADILLWAAEVEIEIGFTDKARDYVNMVRKRAADSSGWVHNENNIPGAKRVTNNQGDFDKINDPSFTDIHPYDWIVRNDLNQTWVLLGIEANGTKIWNAYSVPKYKIGLYINAWTDKEYAKKAVRYERMLELAMEGHRFFDLVRWRIADTEIKAYLDKEKIFRTYLNGANFEPNKHERFPIPQSEIDKSKGTLKQNPGY